MKTLEKHYLSAVNKFVGFIEKVKNYTMNKIQNNYR